MKLPLIKPLLYFFIVLGLLLGSISIYRIYTLLKRPIVAKNPIIIEVKLNSTANSLVQMLYSKKIISSKRLFLNFIKFKGLSHHLKAGIYQVTPGESAEQLIYRIVAGDVYTQQFRIIEGSNLNQVISHLKQAPYLKYNPDDWQSISLKNLSAEGLLLADTYQYVAGESAKPLLQSANKKLLAYLEESWQNRSPDLPYNNSYEMLIAASILEKETALPFERKIIAGVVVNRLLRKMPLQMDPTVIYALGEKYTGKLSHQDLLIDSPYNTYRYRGLPPTPIAMVGKDAIDAAAHPKKSNYIYFVAKGDGTHEFSETYTEQKKAILRYMK